MKASFAARRLFTALTLISLATLSTMAQDNRIGQFDNQGDIGNPKLAGGASYSDAKQEYTISGAGTNMWYGGDQFHFVWTSLRGDFVLRTRVEFIGKGAIAHRKAGWMVRQTLDPDSPYVDCAEHGDGLTSLQIRPNKGANTLQIPLAITNADVLQFERRGTTYIFSAAHSGEPFVSAQTNLDLGDAVSIGLFVCSHTADVVEKAIFRDVRIIKPVKQGFTPYRDFIGSSLEILDVHSGKLEMIYRPLQPIEAPNWTRDGKALVYNVSGRAEGWGRLERFDLATKEISPINTGLAVRNNNDHVLSFNGKMLGISDQSPSHGGQSRVFTVPLKGGTPKQITRLTPSYFHSWSPDGKWLVYTGGRTNKFDIYKMRSDGSGEEIRLTSSEGLNDGPEFTPDGKFIYFNSNRTGKMQIWRMKPDGSDQVQITNDEFNNWFPHISPDGKWIVIISFPADIDSKEHPYYKHVYLRLMPIEGGKPKVVAYVYGGQGTINVPSWSPDSQRIAFVSNSN
jgi:TolB protein